MEKIKQHYTEEELNQMFGFTAESLEEECAIYENDAWEIGSGDVIYDILPDGKKREGHFKKKNDLKKQNRREITWTKYIQKVKLIKYLV